MRGLRLLLTVPLATVIAGSILFAANDVSATLKKMLDQRANDFAAIRTSPHDMGGSTQYMSTLKLPGADECYIAPAEKPHYTDECSVAESKNRAAVLSKYNQYIKALRGVAPASWITWTEKSANPAGEDTYIGPDRTHPAATVRWNIEGMNSNYYLLTVKFFGEGYARK